KRELVIIGQKPGATSVHLWLRDGRQIDVPVEVMDGNAGATVETIRALLADVPNLGVHAVADRVVITGQHINPGVAKRIEALMKLYPSVLDFT
ncbi:pilus assembly protein N-terminal domain-containing protein, partial [Xanthomonas sacchari]|uniref:pilus assembly protein N-terminal domain-containing protein n=1 Tax=Xanthomonas sacchari TaxID=56458 RepID=UPI00225710BE